MQTPYALPLIRMNQIVPSNSPNQLNHSREALSHQLQPLQSRLRRLASRSGFLRLQRTQTWSREKSLSAEPDEKRACERHMGSSSKRRKIFAGLRRKESHKIPVREVEPPRLSEIAHAQCEIVDVAELQHKIKVRQKRLRLISDWLCRASVLIVIICSCVSLYGFLASHIAQHVLWVQEAAASQLEKPWELQCHSSESDQAGTTSKMRRLIHNNVYEETDCRLISISEADWSSWSSCVAGKKQRWKIMEPDQRYKFGEFMDEREC